MSTPVIANDPRVRIFISHSTRDSRVVEALLGSIEGGGVKCFLAPRDIRPQQYWASTLQERIQDANLFLLLYTPASSQSAEVRKEVQDALAMNKEIWVIKEPGAPMTPFYENCDFMKLQAFMLNGGGERACFDAVLDAVNKRWPASDFVPGEVRLDNCPYPGPTPFKKEFENLFFGRRTALNSLLTAIAGEKHVILVYGPSGVGKTSLLTVGLGRELPASWFYSGPVNETSATGLLRGLLASLSGTGASACSELPLNETVNRIVQAVQAGTHNQFIFCFDQMENVFAENASRAEVERVLRSVENILGRSSGKRVAFLISFRKESYADVEWHIKRMFKEDWDGRFIRKLSPEDATECMIQPARCQGVRFDTELAEALVKALEKDQHGESVVDLMDVQKVCKSLWERVAQKDVAHSRVDASTLASLAKRDAELQTNARDFVAEVLTGYMHETIEQIAKGLPAGTAGRNALEYVTLSLLEFVGPAKERLRVNATSAGGRERTVGRLPLKVVNELVNSGLVQQCGEWQYELAHDALAEDIADYSKDYEAVFAVKSLDSVLKRESLFKERHETAFNRNSELLAKLEVVRENNWPFEPEEAEFLVRSALGDQRRNVKGASISLDAWARVLAQKSPERLVQVLKDGLADDSEEAVQLDIISLLHKPDIRALLDEAALDVLGTRVRELSLDSPNSQARARACSALIALGYEPGIQAVFDNFGAPETRVKARIAISMLRHAFDSLNPADDCFPHHWKQLGLWHRMSVLGTLCRWRCRQSYGWILYIMGVAAAFTAVGAIVPFMLLGLNGASLTWGTDYSVAAGVFQGASGGLVWGLGVTTTLLLYCVIWRGGRVRNRARETFGMALWATIGGFLGGLVNAIVITLVFVPDGLVRQGWLAEASSSKWAEFRQAFFRHGTYFGWTTAIFGAALGVGIGWSLAHILADPEERWLPQSRGLGPGKTGQVLVTITKNVLRQSWLNIVWIAIGAVVVVLVIHPGPGTCDHATILAQRLAHLAQRPCTNTDGTPLPLLPSIGLRAAGLGLVILGGSLAQEIAFLFGLFSVQFGVNLKENPQFLRSAQAPQSASTARP